MPRRSALAVVVAVAVLAALGGWLVGQRIKSPAELASEAEPPPPSLLTVPVELRTLASSVITRGDITFSDATDLSVAGSTVGSSIITRLPKAVGDELAEGEVFVEVAGRPVFVLEGELPTFRSFTPGVEGPDVEQLERALAGLGLDPGPTDGRFTAQTESAVEALYARAGYPANEASREELDALAAARDRVRSASRALTDAQASLAEATSGLSS